MSVLFLLLGLGNLITVSMTIPKKLKDRTHSLLKYRFTRLDKYFWPHRKRRDSDRQANPKFSDEVDRVLRRSNSEMLIEVVVKLLERKSSSQKDQNPCHHLPPPLPPRPWQQLQEQLLQQLGRQLQLEQLHQLACCQACPCLPQSAPQCSCQPTRRQPS